MIVWNEYKCSSNIICYCCFHFDVCVYVSLNRQMPDLYLPYQDFAVVKMSSINNNLLKIIKTVHWSMLNINNPRTHAYTYCAFFSVICSIIHFSYRIDVHQSMAICFLYCVRALALNGSIPQMCDIPHDVIDFNVSISSINLLSGFSCEMKIDEKLAVKSCFCYWHCCYSSVPRHGNLIPFIAVALQMHFIGDLTERKPIKNYKCIVAYDYYEKVPEQTNNV